MERERGGGGRGGEGGAVEFVVPIPFFSPRSFMIVENVLRIWISDRLYSITGTLLEFSALYPCTCIQ